MSEITGRTGFRNHPPKSHKPSDTSQFIHECIIRRTSAGGGNLQNPHTRAIPAGRKAAVENGIAKLPRDVLAERRRNLGTCEIVPCDVKITRWPSQFLTKVCTQQGARKAYIKKTKNVRHKPTGTDRSGSATRSFFMVKQCRRWCWCAGHLEIRCIIVFLSLAIISLILHPIAS
jgi:hypothetical protein